MRGVVITGCGAVTPLGIGVGAFWEALLAGRSGAGPIVGFPAADLTPRIVAEVRAPGFDDPNRARAFGEYAAREALRDAGLASVPPRTGVALGTTLGGIRLFEAWDADDLSPARVPEIPYFAPAAALARTLGCTGPVATPQLACASGSWAVGLAADWVGRGQAEVVLAGGTDLLSRFVVAGFNALRATADEARPFDRDRRGLMLGEGAGVVVVESEAHARRRGAPLRARLLGVGAAADAVHMTAPDREGAGAARAMRAALDDARLPPAAVDFVSAHGTGTPYNDAMEAAAIARAFGCHRPAVNSIKGAIGHTLGAAGALEVVVCVQAIAAGLVPPTVGLEAVDPACAGLDLVHGEARPQPVRVALSTSSGFAGTNTALVLGAV